MKRIILSLLLVAFGWAATAQVDSLPAAPSTSPACDSLGSKSFNSVPNYTPKRSREANVLGAPIYYNTQEQFGNQRPQRHYTNSDRPYYSRQHNRSAYDHNFNQFFFEIEYLFGDYTFARGINLAYVPSRWGVYGSYLYGYMSDWMTMGGVFRLLPPDSYTDWQLYGGLAVGMGVGMEAGMRLAFQNFHSNSRFSWWSFSTGMVHTDDCSAFTVGLSIGLSACTALPLVILW